jgi:hypothetical protein
MFNFVRFLNLLSVIALSLFFGAFLFIALVVVKFWQTVEPDIFLSWMSNHFFRFPILILNCDRYLVNLALGQDWACPSSTHLC